MSFHPPSFLIGVGVAATVFAARRRLRPVIVEIGALGSNLAHVGRALAERGLERAEDLLADVRERTRRRERGERGSGEGRAAPTNGNGAPQTNGHGRHGTHGSPRGAA